ncbi:DUF2894 domain-containing protein [Noviherbaspirillum denitrificans]|uniref:DUF2894 domain-containing protein n=1 Tax=Noviherbaspirillum denitrificans TaxID=1968433 RepID=A0A254TBZ6_9BURK|nr:DUF2894 domain-containing protein [Noviherbaspirillum denitrificans]OWW18083.1 hypothetical protein AYR66_02685 [Noviherbaspirillum denitrificans]
MIEQDPAALLAALRAAGAERFDPAGLHYIDALARRAEAHEGSVRRVLDAKLAQAVSRVNERFERAKAEAAEVLAQGVQKHPQAASDLQQLFDAGDFRGLRQRAASLGEREQCASLGALVRQLEQHVPETAVARPEVHVAPRTELKVIRQFRNTWSKLSVDKQVAKALEQAPKNAGPINSHMLVLRSLAMMRDISPDYLNRFISYADTLLCLDQGEKEKPAPPKKQPASKPAKKAR